MIAITIKNIGANLRYGMIYGIDRLLSRAIEPFICNSFLKKILMCSFFDLSIFGTLNTMQNSNSFIHSCFQRPHSFINGSCKSNLDFSRVSLECIDDLKITFLHSFHHQVRPLPGA